MTVQLPIQKPLGTFVMVPTEPTQEMLNAYDDARAATTITPPEGGGVSTHNPHQSYWALLNAVPTDGNKELLRLQAIERAAMALSTAMVDSEANGADYDKVDKQWLRLTLALTPRK